MNEYKVGEWRAELKGSKISNITLNGSEYSLKKSDFAVRRGNNPNIFCMVSVVDDGVSIRSKIWHILGALNEYKGEYATLWRGEEHGPLWDGKSV